MALARFIGWYRAAAGRAPLHGTQQPDDLRQAELQRFFLGVLSISTIGCLAYTLAMAMLSGPNARMIATLLVAAVAPVCLLLLRRGHMQAACAVYIGTLFITIALQSAIYGGLTNAGLQFNTVLVMVTAWLLGKRAARWLWLASLAWLGLLTYGIGTGIFTPQPTAGPGGYLLAMAAIWTMGYLAMQLVFSSYQQHVTQVQQLNTELAANLAAMQAQRSALERSEQRVLQILSASPLPITVADYASGVYVDVNPSWERTFGHSKASVLGKTSMDLGFWKNRDDRQAWIDRFARDGRISGHQVTFQLQDGRERIFWLSSERFLYGERDCVLTMSVDVTERIGLEQDLKELNATLEQRVQARTSELGQANAELRQTMETLQRTQTDLLQSEKLASLGSLVAGVAHEMNTPLGNALLAASTMQEHVAQLSQTLASGTLRKSTLDEFVSQMAQGSTLTQRSLQRATALISSFKQVAVDQESERRRSFDLAQTVGEVLDTLRPSIKHRNVRLLTEVPPGIAMESFPGPLGQVLINLVNNALLHAFPEDRPGTICIDASHVPGDKQVWIVVSDDGVGIPEKDVASIFDPFFTTKRGKGGSGLGLPVSHRIVSRILGGRMQVMASPGQGARFEVVLPVVAPAVIA